MKVVKKENMMLEGSETELGAEFPLDKVVQKLLIVGPGGEPIHYEYIVRLYEKLIKCDIINMIYD